MDQLWLPNRNVWLCWKICRVPTELTRIRDWEFGAEATTNLLVINSGLYTFANWQALWDEKGQSWTRPSPSASLGVSANSGVSGQGRALLDEPTTGDLNAYLWAVTAQLACSGGYGDLW